MNPSKRADIASKAKANEPFTESEIMKLMALQRAGLLKIDGVRVRLWVDCGRYRAAPEPTYLHECADFVSRKRLRKAIKEAA